MRLTILNDERTRVIARVALILVAALPFVVLPVLGDPFQVPRAVVSGLAIAGLMLAWRRDVSTQGPARVAPGVLAFLVLWFALAAAVGEPASSIWGVHGRYQGLVSGILLVLAGIAGAQMPRRLVRWLAGALAAALAVQSAVVLAGSLAGGDPVGTFGNRAIAGAWLAVAVAVTAAAASTARSRDRVLLMTATLAGVLALGATGTRGAWLGAAAGGAVVLSGAGGLRPRTRVAVAAGVLAVLVAAVLAFAGAGSVAKLSPASLGSGSAASRLQIWRGSMSMIAARPLTGVGPGRFLYEFPRHQPLEHARTEAPDVRPDQAHSQLLQLTAEAGIPAALAALALAALAIAAGVRGTRRGDGAAFVALAGLAAYLGQGVFGVAALETDVLGWLLGGIAVGAALAPRAEGPAPATGGPPDTRRGRHGRIALAGVGLALLATSASALYAVADARYLRGITRFERGDLAVAAQEARRASALDPWTDVYRVALSDVALYDSEESLVEALDSLDRGLVLEPRSYDLALARARVLERLGRPAGEVAEAYVEAQDRYPLGIEVRREAIGALLAAGRRAEASEMARGLLLLVPNDPTASDAAR